MSLSTRNEEDLQTKNKEAGENTSNNIRGTHTYDGKILSAHWRSQSEEIQ